MQVIYDPKTGFIYIAEVMTTKYIFYICKCQMQ